MTFSVANHCHNARGASNNAVNCNLHEARKSGGISLRWVRMAPALETPKIAIPNTAQTNVGTLDPLMQFTTR